MKATLIRNLTYMFPDLDASDVQDLLNIARLYARNDGEKWRKHIRKVLRDGLPADIFEHKDELRVVPPSFISSPTPHIFPIENNINPWELMKSAQRTRLSAPVYVDPELQHIFGACEGVVPREVGFVERTLLANAKDDRIATVVPKSDHLSPRACFYLLANERYKLLSGRSMVTTGWNQERNEWNVYVPAPNRRTWRSGSVIV
jgi:hypothetical protein